MTLVPAYPLLRDVFASDAPDAAPAVNDVLARMTDADPWDYDYLPLREVQLDAFNERLAQRRSAVPMLAQRVAQVGRGEACDLDAVVAFLFSEDVYKSYPQTLVAKGRWAQLLRWLDGLSADRLDGVDVAGAADLDDFLARLRAAGHYVFTTSGTTGKVSLLPESIVDAERSAECLLRSYGAMWGINSARPHPLYYFGHRSGPYRGAMILEAMTRAYGRPKTTHALFEEPLLVGAISRTAELSAAMAKGTATPSQIAELEAGQQHARENSTTALDHMLDLLIAENEPVYAWGLLYPLYLLMERARERSLSLQLPVGSAIVVGGGTKNNRLPDGYLEDLGAFYGVPLRTGYGQSELHGNFPQCLQGRWHVPPTILLLLTDEDRSRVLNPDHGIAEGLAATFDFSPLGRWGGLLSDDVLAVDFSPCGCGRRSPSVLDVHRFDRNSLGGDKLNCAGRIEMYMRGIGDTSDTSDAR